MQNSCRIRMKVASRSPCDAILSRSLFSSSTFADVDLRQSPSCLTLTARGRAAIYPDTDLERCSEGVFVLERTEQIVKPTPSQPSPLCLARQRIIDSVCVCVCLLNVWLAGSGVRVVRTLEATSWRTTSDPAHLPRYTLTPSLRSDTAGSCRKWLIVCNVRAGFEGEIRLITAPKSGWLSRSAVWLCPHQTKMDTQNRRRLLLHTGTFFERDVCVWTQIVLTMKVRSHNRAAGWSSTAEGLFQIRLCVVPWFSRCISKSADTQFSPNNVYTHQKNEKLGVMVALTSWM